MSRGLCLLFDSCDPLDETCRDCVTGEGRCPVCELAGKCDGTEIGGQFETQGIFECEEICADATLLDPPCSFYSFDPRGAWCWLFTSCANPSVAECPDCTSSQVGCLTSGNDGKE